MVTASLPASAGCWETVLLRDSGVKLRLLEAQPVFSRPLVPSVSSLETGRQVKAEIEILHENLIIF